MKTVQQIAADLIINIVMPECGKRGLSVENWPVLPAEIAYAAARIHAGMNTHNFVKLVLRDIIRSA